VSVVPDFPKEPILRAVILWVSAIAAIVIINNFSVIRVLELPLFLWSIVGTITALIITIIAILKVTQWSNKQSAGRRQLEEKKKQEQRKLAEEAQREAQEEKRKLAAEDRVKRQQETIASVNKLNKRKPDIIKTQEANKKDMENEGLNKCYLLYTLKTDDKYFVGTTTNLEKSMAKHFYGTGYAFTKKWSRPKSLLYCIKLGDISESKATYYKDAWVIHLMDKTGGAHNVFMRQNQSSDARYRKGFLSKYNVELYGTSTRIKDIPLNIIQTIQEIKKMKNYTKNNHRADIYQKSFQGI
jgi:uncharacterized membrane protein